jgi:lipid II:glycine glycyltransferase (peptidoglycan interpeptide bridge formation enzyme)
VLRFAGDGSLAQIVELPLPLGRKYWFCPKGPILARGAWQIANSFTDELKNMAKGAGAVFLRMEPGIVASLSVPRNDENKTVIASPSTLLGAKQSPHDINPRATSIVDLSQTEEELLAAMHQKTRYNIRVAEKHGVSVGPWSMVHGSFDRIWELFDQTAKRDRFRLHPRGYYEKQIKIPGIEVFGAEHEDKLLAAAIIIFFGDTATYLHGASSNEMRNVMAPHALHWAIIKRAKESGMKYYDLWGISDDQKSGWAGITRFKRGFGGADVSAPGTFDLPVNKFWYSVYTLVRRMRP